MKPSLARCQKRIWVLVGFLVVICAAAILFIPATTNRSHVPDDAGFHLYVDFSAYADHPDGFGIETDIGVYLNEELSKKLTSKCVDPNLYRRRYAVSFSETAEPADTYYISAPTLQLGDLTIIPTDLPLSSSLDDDRIELILVKRSE